MRLLFNICSSLLIGSFLSVSNLFVDSSPLLAQSVTASLSYGQVESSVAKSGLTNVYVSPGRVAVVDFSETDQVITYIGVGDPSRIVYNTDLPLSSGRSQSLFLLPIQKLEFEGATTAVYTNLVLKTVDTQGVTHLYNFQINHTNSVQTLGVKIIPTAPLPVVKVDNQYLKVGFNRHANLDDIINGLNLSLRNEYILTGDPIVLEIRKLVATVRNSDKTIGEVADQLGLNTAAIVSLAELGLEDRDSRISNVSTSKIVASQSEERSRVEPDLITRKATVEVTEISFIDQEIDYVSLANNLFFYWDRSKENFGLSVLEKKRVNRAIVSFRSGSSFEESFVDVDISVIQLFTEYLKDQGRAISF